jgi:hypothetical protein
LGWTDRVVGQEASYFDGVSMSRQAARIHAVDVDVGARRRRDEIVDLMLHVGRVRIGDGIRDVVVDAFAEIHDRFAPAAHAPM